MHISYFPAFRICRFYMPEHFRQNRNVSLLPTTPSSSTDTEWSWWVSHLALLIALSHISCLSLYSCFNNIVLIKQVSTYLSPNRLYTSKPPKSGSYMGAWVPGCFGGSVKCLTFDLNSDLDHGVQALHGLFTGLHVGLYIWLHTGHGANLKKKKSLCSYLFLNFSKFISMIYTD